MRNPPKGVSGGQIYSCKNQAELDKLLGVQKELNNDESNNENTGISE